MSKRHTERYLLALYLSSQPSSSWHLRSRPQSGATGELHGWLATYAPIREAALSTASCGVEADVSRPRLRCSSNAAPTSSPSRITGLLFLSANATSESVPAEPLIYRGRGNSHFKKWKLGDKVWVDGVPKAADAAGTSESIPRTSLPYDVDAATHTRSKTSTVAHRIPHPTGFIQLSMPMSAYSGSSIHLPKHKRPPG